MTKFFIYFCSILVLILGLFLPIINWYLQEPLPCDFLTICKNSTLSFPDKIPSLSTNIVFLQSCYLKLDISINHTELSTCPIFLNSQNFLTFFVPASSHENDCVSNEIIIFITYEKPMEEYTKVNQRPLFIKIWCIFNLD